MWRSVAVVFCALACGCRQQAPAPLRGDGELVLELGGNSRSLRASLVSLGVELAPPREQPDEAVPPPRSGGSADRPAGDQRDDATPGDVAGGQQPATPDGGSRSAAEPPADPGWFEVELRARQTLMDLSLEHLGTARRFKEIMELNGWSDRDARRLKVGQKVKIPGTPGR